MISVIVSIYKMEKFMDHCIRTLLNQTYEDYELILVDDGSPDRCGEKCDEWEKQEEKIRAYHKPNGGLSSARNFGITHARGDMIIFPDPDDWVEPDYLEKMVAIREKNNADLSICGFYDFSKGQDKIHTPGGNVVVLDTESAMKMLMHPSHFCGFTWNKLYDMEIIKEHGLRFDEELGMVQDLHFNVRYFQYCRTVVYDPVPLYHYNHHNEGVTSVYAPLSARRLSGLLTYKKIAEITLDQHPQISSIAYSSLCKMCLEDIYIYYRSGMNSPDTLSMLWKDFCKYRKHFYRSAAYTKKDNRCARFAVIHPRLYFDTFRIYRRFVRSVEKGKNEVS